jgi:hypothetical protein
MNDLELIFTMLGERVTTELTRQENAQDFDKCEDTAKRGGKVAGNAKRETEKELKRPITTTKNYLHDHKKRNSLNGKDKNKI